MKIHSKTKLIICASHFQTFPFTKYKNFTNNEKNTFYKLSERGKRVSFAYQSINNFMSSECLTGKEKRKKQGQVCIK